MAIAATIATSAHPEKSIWTHNPTMYVAYGFLALAALLGAKALGLLGRLRSTATSFLPRVRIEAPTRRLRRRRYDTDHARALLGAGRMGERLSQTFDVGEPEITPKSVGYPLRPKRSELAKAAGTSPPLSRLAPAAAGEPSPESEDARKLREYGEFLNEELWEHVRDAERLQRFPPPGLPGVYLGKVRDWHDRFLKFADPRLTTKQQAAIVPYPLMVVRMVPFSARPAAKAIEAMFANNLSVLRELEGRL